MYRGMTMRDAYLQDPRPRDPFSHILYATQYFHQVNSALPSLQPSLVETGYEVRVDINNSAVGGTPCAFRLRLSACGVVHCAT